MENKREQVEPGKFVAYSYRLYNDADNSLLFETPAGEPDVMVFGVSHEIIPGLTATLKGLSAGDRFGVTLPPEAAFGPRMEDYVLTLDRDIFERDGEMPEEVKAGARLPMMTQEGYRVEGVVTAIGDKVTMDFNHPFAGLTVRYEGTVDEVRDATPEELTPTSGCCGGCHGGDCGSSSDCGGGSCGDGCSGGSCCK